MIRRIPTYALLATLALSASAKQVIKMGVQEGKVRFSIEAFTVAPGTEVEIHFHNNDHEMAHNIVVCKNDKDVLNQVGMAAVMLADKAEAMNYVPDHPSILYASKLVKAGETTVFSFTAPKKEGTYPYLCTLPGHYLLMRGIMTVGDEAPSVDSPLYNLNYKRYATLAPKPKLDDFSAFKDVATGTVDDGLLNLMIGNLDGDTDATPPFALEYTGQLVIPKTGKYRFTLDVIGPIEIKLADNVLFHNTNGRRTYIANSDELTLKRGIYPLSLRYLAYSGPVFRKRSLRSNVKLALKHPDGTYQQLTRSMPQPPAPSTALVPDKGEAYVFRSHVEGSGPASIHVGFDDGISYSFDTKTCRLTQAWSGGFLDAAGDWTSRGGKGAKIIGKRFHQIKPNLPPYYLKSGFGHMHVTFKSYELDQSGAPVFHFLINDLPATLKVARKNGVLTQRVNVPECDEELLYQLNDKRLPFVKTGNAATLEFEVAQ